MIKRKRILFFQPNAKLGGSFQSLYYLLENIDKNKYEAIVLFPEENTILIERLKNVQAKSIVCYFPSIGYAINYKYRTLLTSLVKFFFLKKYYLKKFPNLSVDLIHLNSLDSIFGCFVSKKLRVPVIWHIREQLAPTFNDSMRKYFMKFIKDDVVKSIICISENESIGLPAEKVKVIHNFYRLERQAFKTNKPIKFLSIGSFTFDKGFWLLIEAVRYLRGKYDSNDFKICLMGISSRKTIIKRILREKMEEHFRKEVRRYNIEDFFDFYKQQEELTPSFFSDFHVLIRPSLYEDPWGRDIIEAMSTGRPIIATGKYSKFVRDGVNGYLVQGLNPVELGKKMQKFIEEDQLIRTFGKNSYCLAKKKFDPFKNTKEIETIYENLLS